MRVTQEAANEVLDELGIYRYGDTPLSMVIKLAVHVVELRNEVQELKQDAVQRGGS